MGNARIFRSPRDIVWGRGSLGHLERIPGKKALIVTDGVMKKLGLVARAEGYLRQAGMAVRVFDGVEPEAAIQTVMKIVEENKEFQPEVIVALGGGSVIDASKAFRVFYEHPHLTFDQVHALHGPPKEAIPPFTRTIHVAISSTSGTGSDASHVCIVTDPAIHAKCPIVNPVLKPEVAIVDPDMADSMPKTVLADTALDALTHALESYVSGLANDFSRGLSLESIRLLMRYLPPAYLENDREAKEHVHYAATLAGLAFSNSANGICHTVATKVGGVFKLTHGRGNAIALPYAIRYNSPVAGELFTAVSRAIGYQGADPAEALDYLLGRIRQLQKQCGMPGSYREAGLDEAAYHARIEEFARSSGTYPTTLTNPRKPTVEELESLYRACYCGDYGLIP